MTYKPKLKGWYCKWCGSEIYMPEILDGVVSEELTAVYCPRCMVNRKKRRMFRIKDGEEE